MLTMVVNDHWSDGKRIHVTGILTASGNYPAGGDLIPTNTEIKTSSAPVWMTGLGLGAYDYIFTPLNTVLPTTGLVTKMRAILSSTGVELAAGAYPIGITGNPINFYAIFPKFI